MWYRLLLSLQTRATGYSHAFHVASEQLLTQAEYEKPNRMPRLHLSLRDLIGWDQLYLTFSVDDWGALLRLCFFYFLAADVSILSPVVGLHTLCLHTSHILYHLWTWLSVSQGLILLSSVMQYMDRTFVKNFHRTPVYARGMEIWTEEVIRNNDVGDRLLSIFLEQAWSTQLVQTTSDWGFAWWFAMLLPCTPGISYFCTNITWCC